MPGDQQSRNGAVESARESDSLGPGDGGIAGGGRGSGVGNGQGSGIDEGLGGGTGGGPFRIGAGIQPPRIIREVKPLYSDEARRLGVAGEVLLDVVVQRDGRVGTVRLLRGLRPDLNERAIEAVRQWIFSPAIRNGSPVDVLVEVAVEFNIR
jgi:protein TonB